MTDPRKKAVIIGASAGAVDALSAILPDLPAEFSCPVYIVVHVPPRSPSVLAGIFSAKCRLPVVEVTDKEPVTAGSIYFAPPNYHMLIEDKEHVALSNDAEVLFSRPSIDVAFESAAEVWGECLTGIILTGANQDGARGLQAVAANAGVAIVQDPATAYAKAMPEAAIAACPQAQIMSLADIATYLKGASK